MRSCGYGGAIEPLRGDSCPLRRVYRVLRVTSSRGSPSGGCFFGFSSGRPSVIVPDRGLLMQDPHLPILKLKVIRPSRTQLWSTNDPRHRQTNTFTTDEDHELLSPLKT